VDVEAVKELKRPVELGEIKKEGALSDMVLVNNTRLSVQPVNKNEFDYIIKMSEQ